VGIVTVIAGKIEEDKIVIGSDGQRTWGWQAKEVLQDGKLIVLPDIIVGGAGYGSHNNHMAVYLTSHKPQSSEKRDILQFFVEFNQWCDKMIKNFESQNCWLLAYDGRLTSVTYDLSVNYHDYWAVGSGWEYARTALHLGKTVEEAIEVACELTIFCAPPILIHELPMDVRPAKPGGRGNSQ
jgi:ATP-dependent protease HslVU (ClpYQ) peptidase subunit